MKFKIAFVEKKLEPDIHGANKFCFMLVFY